MNELEEKLHRTWIQLLIDNNHRDLTAIIIDGDLEVIPVPSVFTEHGHYANHGLAVGIPNEYYDVIISNEVHERVIGNSLDKLFRSYNMIPDDYNILIEIRIKLIDIEEGWKDKIRGLILNAKEANQGIVTEKLFAKRGKKPLVYNEMKFASGSEIRIAQELEVRRVLFFPLPLAVRSDTGAPYLDHREPDFLICQDGVWGILEIALHPPDRYEKDSEKEIWFKKSGILCIQHYTSERCFDHPSEIVDEFLQLLAKYKR